MTRSHQDSGPLPREVDESDPKADDTDATDGYGGEQRECRNASPGAGHSPAPRRIRIRDLVVGALA